MLPTPAQPLNLDGIDRNLQTIRTLEGSWSLPGLPDEVKLDLASSPSLTPDSMSSFMLGLDEDIAQAQRQQPYAVRNPGVWVPGADDLYSSQEQIGRLIYGVTGSGAPRQYDVEAVQNWKRRAVEEGYLDLTAEQVNSPVWLPEYGSIARQMTVDQAQAEFAGDKPGSVPISSVMNFIEDWVTPRGLYQAALHLDLFWDVPEIVDEFDAWGNKWEEVLNEPLSPSNWIDALTGPLDDIVFPVINWALMFTGMGEIMATGKGLALGAKAAQSWRATSGLYAGARGLRFGGKFGTALERALVAEDVGADIAKFKNQSFWSMMLTPTPGPGKLNTLRNTAPVKAMSDLGVQWRGLSSTVMMKKANQQVFRAGVMSNVQSLVGDTHGGGNTLASWTSVDEWIATPFENWAVDLAVDALLYPPNIFEPGTIARTIGAAAGTAKDIVNLPSRITRTAPVWSDVTNSEKLVGAYYEPVQDFLRRHVDDDAAKAFRKNVRTVGMKKALADVLTGGDVDQLGAAMTYTSIMSVLDGHAKQAALLGSTEAKLLEAGDHTRYLAARDKAVAQLRRYDPTDVDTLLETLARYGPPAIDDAAADALVAGTTMYRKAEEIEKRIWRLRKQYLETKEEALARGGQVQEGHRRLYGWRDPENPDNIRWSSNRADALDDDPFFADVSLDEIASMDQLTPEAVAKALDNPERAQEAGDRLGRRYMMRDGDGTYQQMRESDAHWYRQYKQDKLSNLRLLAGGQNEKRAGFLATLTNQLTPESLEQYVYETLPSFSRWTGFNVAESEIRAAIGKGQLVNARISPAVSESGHGLALFKHMPGGEKWSNEVYKVITAIADDVDQVKMMNQSIFSPLVRTLDPSMGRFTAALKDTVTKQEALTFGQEVSQTLNRLKNIRKFRAGGKWEDLISEADELMAGMQGTLAGEGRMAEAQIKDVATQLAANFNLSGKSETQVRMLIRLANKEGVSVSEIEGVLERHLQVLSDAPAWVERYRVPTTVSANAKDVVEKVEKQLKELGSQSNFMASAVDDVPKALKESLDNRGYKLVYGVEFAAPGDVMDLIPEFADMSRRQVGQMSLQRWFGRQEPDYVRRLKARKARSSLIGAMKRAKDAGREINIELPDSPDATKGTTDLDKLINDLYNMLHRVQEDAATARLEASEGGTVAKKLGTRVGQARIPLSIDRLASDLSFKEFKRMMAGGPGSAGMGYTTDEAVAVMNGLQQSQSLGFQTHGLFAIESYLRSRPQAVDGLRLLGRQAIEGTGKKITAGGMDIVGGIGVGAASTFEHNQRFEDSSAFTSLAAGLAGGAVGLMGSHALQRKMLGAEARAGKWATALEHSEDWAKWSYMADGLANMRDMFRFSLSPIFDASRYSEAIILGQITELPEGMRNLRINQSPKSVRKLWYREALAEGLSKDAARARVAKEWANTQGEFAAAAKGDFDYETIDGVGRRFSSVGIIGFSPADWMTSTFSLLRKNGVDAGKAYEIVRDMHTYGTTGRSAAELSMNFVFFPFSFTKKVMTHMGKFFAQDMGRLVMIHDAMKTYDILNERYDLSREFKDRLPVLERMHRMNLLAYGIGPGRYGGVNAPLIGVARNMPVVGDAMWPLLPEIDDISNMFVPQQVTVNNEEDANNLEDIFRQALPALNDVNQLWQDTQKQMQVFTSNQHITREAEADRAWDEWRAYQDTVAPTLDKAGMTWAQAMNNEAFNAMVKKKRAEIATEYPAWIPAIGDGVANAAAIDEELNQRLLNPQGPVDDKLQTFEIQFDMIKKALASNGITFSNPHEIPPEVYRALHKEAIRLATGDQAFLRLYNRFYRRMLGDISTEMV